MLTILQWLFFGYAGLLFVLSLFVFSAAFYITKNMAVSLKFCIYFAVDLTFQLFSRGIGNILAAFATDSKFNIRWQWAKLLWQTPDSTMNGGGVYGDQSYSLTYGGIGGDSGFYKKWRIITEWAGTYNSRTSQVWNRIKVAWMWTQRNCSHGFSCYVTGLTRDKIAHITFFRDGDKVKNLVYSNSGNLIGFEFKNKGFLFGYGDCYIGWKVDRWQTWFPAQLVYRLRPFSKQRK